MLAMISLRFARTLLCRAQRLARSPALQNIQPGFAFRFKTRSFAKSRFLRGSQTNQTISLRDTIAIRDSIFARPGLCKDHFPDLGPLDFRDTRANQSGFFSGLKYNLLYYVRK